MMPDRTRFRPNSPDHEPPRTLPSRRSCSVPAKLPASVEIFTSHVPAASDPFLIACGAAWVMRTLEK